MHELASNFLSDICTGLLKTSLTAPSKWAMLYRIMGGTFPGPMTFRYHPWTKEMHDCNADMMVGQKAAQVGYTEVALNRAFFTIDKGQSVLYVLPTATPDATDFSAARFDSALELSPYLSNLFTAVKNVKHKRAGSASLYIRGSRSRSQLKSIPVSLVILDEIDEFVQENIPLIFERMSGQNIKNSIIISTPTIANYGVNSYFTDSTQNHFFFKCPHCSRLTELIYPDCLNITADALNDPRIEDSYILCKECKHSLDHQAKPDILSTGRWVKSFTNQNIEGYYINQLYSSTIKPSEIATSVIKASIDPYEEQELYNSKLGLVHEPKGSRITNEDIEKCTGTFIQVENAKVFATMGIDVGKWFHYEITTYTLDNYNPMDINLSVKAKILKVGKVKDLNDLDKLIRLFHVCFTVIDANPEFRTAFELSQRFYGRVKLCFYTQTGKKQIAIHNEEEATITVDRTAWMDLGLGRIKSQRIALPKDLSQEYKDQLKAPVRLMKKDQFGNPIIVYVTGNEDDHFAHARTYSEIALPFGASMMKNQDLRDVY